LSDYDYYYFSDEERPKLNESDTAFKLFGGYMFNDYVGVEAAYLDMGQVSKTFGYDGGDFSLYSGEVTVDTELTGITVQLVGQYPIVPVDLFAKEYIDRDRSSFEGTNTVWGVGVRYNFDRYAVRVEYEDFDVSELDDLNIISLGVEYRF
jgi:OOP family OmpA-OmpF porin